MKEYKPFQRNPFISPNRMIREGDWVQWSSHRVLCPRAESVAGQPDTCCNVPPFDQFTPSGVSVADPVRVNIKSPLFEPLGGSKALRPQRSTKIRDDNPFSVLGGLEKAQQKKERCARSGFLRRKARKIVKLLRVEQSLKADLKLPSHFVCGSLRSIVRSIYTHELTQVQELSIKTSMKSEPQPCQFCEGKQDAKIEEYKRDRLRPAEVDSSALDDFSRAFSANVPQGWNRNKTVYIPNGHATSSTSRSKGGNWVEGAFGVEPSVKLVHSAGKPRIVTLYPEFNVRVLTPLHHSLYSCIKGRNWLLVGSPTNERLRYLEGGTSGSDWLSFDYEQATDRIKVAYVQRATEILIDKGEGLSEDEIRCLRVMSSLSLDAQSAGTGQPMGSPMSFPLLCLVNKTVVDLALTDLLIKGEITFKEWTCHRCLINGDDLLTKSTSKGDLVAAVAMRGAQVGLTTNREKTMRDPEYGEINSTVFKNCVLQKKTNVSSLWMKADVADVLQYANESCVTTRGFTMVVENNVSRLARSKIKTSISLPYHRKVALMSKRKVCSALAARPSRSVRPCTNLLPVIPVPDGYDLSREEEDAVVLSEVQRIRERRLYVGLAAEARRLRDERKRVGVVYDESRLRRGKHKILRPIKTNPGNTVLCVLARAWENKRKEEVLAGEPLVQFTFTAPSSLNPFISENWPFRPSGRKIDVLVKEIKTFKKRRQAHSFCTESISGLSARADGYVSLADV